MAVEIPSVSLPFPSGYLLGSPRDREQGAGSPERWNALLARRKRAVDRRRVGSWLIACGARMGAHSRRQGVLCHAGSQPRRLRDFRLEHCPVSGAGKDMGQAYFSIFCGRLGRLADTDRQGGHVTDDLGNTASSSVRMVHPGLSATRERFGSNKNVRTEKKVSGTIFDRLHVAQVVPGTVLCAVLCGRAGHRGWQVNPSSFKGNETRVRLPKTGGTECFIRRRRRRLTRVPDGFDRERAGVRSRSS